MGGKELHEKFFPELAKKILVQYAADITNIDKDDRALLLKVKNAMEKRNVEEKMRDFLEKEGARTMMTQFESRASLMRIADAVFYKLSLMMKDLKMWPLPQNHAIQTNKPLNQNDADFSMQTKSGYVFLRGTLDERTQCMDVALRARIRIAGHEFAGADVKAHVDAQLKKQTYPFDYNIRFVSDDDVLEAALTFKAKREQNKGKGKSNKRNL